MGHPGILRAASIRAQLKHGVKSEQGLSRGCPCSRESIELRGALEEVVAETQTVEKGTNRRPVVKTLTTCFERDP